jgi:hypothetical protein
MAAETNAQKGRKRETESAREVNLKSIVTNKLPPEIVLLVPSFGYLIAYQRSRRKCLLREIYKRKNIESQPT